MMENANETKIAAGVNAATTEEMNAIESTSDNFAVDAVTPGPTPVDLKTTRTEPTFGQEMTETIYSAHAAVAQALEGAARGHGLAEDIEMSEATEEASASATEEASASATEETSTSASEEVNVPATTPTTTPTFLNLPPQLVKEQLKYCQRILQGLKRHREAGPFLLPVDPVALNIPDYFTVIKQPMDLGTISKKFNLNEYASAEAFIADVRVMLTNCFTYNAPESQVTKMGRNLEKYFNTSMAKLPSELGNSSASASASASGSASSLPAGESASPSSALARPKRESVSVPGGAPRRGSAVSSATLSFCSSVLRELMKKTNAHLNWPFMVPVDPVALNIPDYFEVVKQPMDLSTIRKKLDTGLYSRADQFEADVRLVFANCYTYNPPESDVTRMARELESIFEQKMAAKPAPKPQPQAVHAPAPAAVQSSSSSMASLPPHAGSSFIPSSASQLIPGLDALEDDSEKILAINHQIQILQAELNYLLINRKSSSSASLAGGSKSSVHAAAGPSRPKKKSPASSVASALKSTAPASAAASPPPDEMTFDEKRQLSEDVSNLAQENMMRILEIIQECMPNLHSNGDSDVIELDIEALDLRTLRALQGYIWECHNPGKKRKPSNNSSSLKPPAASVKKSKEAAGHQTNNSGAYDSSSSSSSEDDD